MKRLVILSLIAAAAYALVFAAGCINVPDPHSHDHEDEAHTEASQEEPSQEHEAKETPEEPPQRFVTLEQAQKVLASPDAVQRANFAPQLAAAMYGPEKQEIRALVLRLAREDKAGQVRAAAVSLLAPLVDEYFQDILRASHDSDPQVRAAAAAALGHSIEQSGRALVRMKQLMNDPDSKVQRAASDLIVNLTDTNRLIAGLGQLEHDQSARFAIQLAVSGPKVIQPLIQMLDTSQNPRQREAGATVLWMVCSGESPEQRKYALWGKAEYFHQTTERPPANRVAVPTLIKLLTSDPDPGVRETAAQGLGHLGDFKAVPALTRALSDPSEYVRRRAASALVVLPDERAIEPLARAAREDKSAGVRAYATEALGWIKSEEAVQAIIPVLKDPDPWVRRSAAMQLGRVGDREAVGALVEAMKDTDADVRWEAVKAVGEFADPATKPALLACLNDPSAPVQHAAEAALQKLGYHRAITGLKAEAQQGS